MHANTWLTFSGITSAAQVPRGGAAGASAGILPALDVLHGWSRGRVPMSSTMWKIALRTLARDKPYALLNVAGLALFVGR